jgi:hypothetical protein
MKTILTEEQRMRLRELQDRADAGESLTTAEQADLENLLRRVEDGEAEYLQPANLRLQQQSERLEGYNARLDELVTRKQVLADNLRRTLEEVQAEQTAIDEEVRRLLGNKEFSDLPVNR